MRIARLTKSSSLLALTGLLGASLVGIQTTAYAADPTSPQTITASGSFTVPASAKNIRVTLKGASGADTNNPVSLEPIPNTGAPGGTVQISLPNSYAGQQLDFIVGTVGGGSHTNPESSALTAPRGGGGGTAVSKGSQVLAVVGGGGGGGAGYDANSQDIVGAAGGAGGFPDNNNNLVNGNNGERAIADNGSTAPGVGGAVVGGPAGVSTEPRTDQGTFGEKGDDAIMSTPTVALAQGGYGSFYAGSGGSGCTGGGGGSNWKNQDRSFTDLGAGGGGSGCLPSGSDASVVADSQGANIGAGSAEISWTGQVPWSRISGVNRYDTAAKISQAAYPDGVTPPHGTGVVYVVNGLGFADSLSAGPAAVAEEAPVLLTAPTVLPPETLTELQRLRPTKIVVVGGTASVSAAVEAQLAVVAPVTRVAGDNRYATSRAVAGYAFSNEAWAFIATGSGFADALSAGSAAASLHYPLILVDGTQATLDAATVTALTKLGSQSALIIGGINSVSTGIETDLQTRYGASNVERYSGADRYKTSVKLNLEIYASPSTAYIASGVTFPDALAGAALAGIPSGNPLYVSPTSCVTQEIYNAITGGESLTQIVLLGGANSLSDDVGKLKIC